MYADSVTTASTQDVIASDSTKFVPGLFAAILGCVLLFASGFAQTAGFTETNVLYNAAHDARHSAGFPCH